MIVAKGNTVKNYGLSGVRYHYTITTQFKDNKMKVVIEPNRITPDAGNMEYPTVEKFYSDYKDNKNGVLSRTGAKGFKEFMLVDLVYNNDKSIVDNITKEVINYNSF